MRPAIAIAPAFGALCLLAARSALPGESPAPILPAQDAYPHVGRDGRVVFQSKRLGGHWKLFTARLDGTDLRQLTDGPGDDVTPKWSPDGKEIVVPGRHRIAFVSNREDVHQIFVMNADGSAPTRVVTSAYTDLRPQWLPGSGLVFNREREGRTELWQVRLPPELRSAAH